jgi:hypothetical protein
MAPTEFVRLKDKIAALKAQMQAFKAMEAEVHAAPDQQISLTDPGARAMGRNRRPPDPAPITQQRFCTTSVEGGHL